MIAALRVWGGGINWPILNACRANWCEAQVRALGRGAVVWAEDVWIALARHAQLRLSAVAFRSQISRH